MNQGKREPQKSLKVLRFQIFNTIQTAAFRTHLSLRATQHLHLSSKVSLLSLITSYINSAFNLNQS